MEACGPIPDPFPIVYDYRYYRYKFICLLHPRYIFICVYPVCCFIPLGIAVILLFVDAIIIPHNPHWHSIMDMFLPFYTEDYKLCSMLCRLLPYFYIIPGRLDAFNIFFNFNHFINANFNIK